MAVEGVTWIGPTELEPLVGRIDELEPFPDNPRRGNVAAIADSLNRFGQTKPVVRDGTRLVAGHHVVQAAQLLGWTHVAAVDTTFANEDEQRAFMLADNRTSDVGDYDSSKLLDQIRQLASLDGTGYDDRALAELQAYVDLQGFSPDLEPGIGTGEVTDEDIAAAQARGGGGSRQTPLQILCPHCGEEFFIQQ